MYPVVTGLAIMFYAAYCIRPMLVYGLDADSNLENKNVLNPDNEYFEYFHGVEGKPGRDFPIYSYIPRTNFNCRGIESGYYADLEADCQVFHICEEGKKVSFLCPNGTIFQQSELICEWWNKVNCTNSPNLYEESAERLQNDVSRRKSSRRIVSLNGAETDHGAIMRMEERSSVRATKNGKAYPIQQQAQRNQRTKNHRIPDNNDIEQQIQEAESNNRHLANAQNIVPTSQTNSFVNQNQKYPNHNYRGTYDVDNDATLSSRSKQTKKDIDRDTGNFINQNYDQASTRHFTKVDQGEKNSFDFGTKTVQQKGTTLKEYHVEFGPTSSGIDSSTNSYNLLNDASYFSTRQRLIVDSSSESPNGYHDTKLVKNIVDSGSFPNESNIPQNTRPTKTSTVATSNQDHKTSYENNEYGTKLSNRNIFSSTTLATEHQQAGQKSSLFSGSFTNPPSQRSKQNPTTNGKASRGSIKYNTNPNYFNNQQSIDETTKNPFKSLPVTTYSPPEKSFYSKVPQSNQVSNHDTSTTDNYDLLFPKHKSEQSQPNSFTFGSQLSTVIPKLSDISVSSTEASSKFIPNRTSVDVTRKVANNQNFKSQESDETQVPQESSSFVKSSFNSITDSSFKTSSSPYPNHRSTYSDIKDISYLEAPKIQSISSITAHLVTTQPINNGKPYVGSRVGTTLLPNQPTTHSKYTYLPTSTDSSKPTVIFGVIRHSSTAELPPYGPPELFNLVRDTELPISDRFNIGNTDKSRPTVETTTPVTNRLPTESFNVGSTESPLKPNVIPGYETTTIKPLDISVPEHGSLNLGTGEADVKQSTGELEFTNKNQAAFQSSDTDETSILDRFNFNNLDKTGPTFETNTLITNTVPAENFNGGIAGKPTEPNLIPSFGISTVKPSDRFNIGSTDKTLPPIETTTLVTNPVPTEAFNVGYTDGTIKQNIVPTFGTSTVKPLDIYVPEHGSLNLGQNVANVNDGYNGLEPISEPPFIKKNVPLLYSNQNTPISTVRTVDHATIYGSYVSTTQRPFGVSNNTPYSPTVPTVTHSSLPSNSPVYGSTTSPRTPKVFNEGIPIRFANGQDKISIQLSRNLGGQTLTNEQSRYKSTPQPSLRKVNAVVRIGDTKQFGSSGTIVAPYAQQNGFYVTEDFNKQVPSSYSSARKSKTERPRPFARTIGTDEEFNTGNTNVESNSIGSTFPAYQISSARPFGVSQTTPSTPFITTKIPTSFSVYDNVDSMMNVLQEIANYNSQNDIPGNPRPGLIIPPSVGPQTLHSLAQYFANELQKTDPGKEALNPETKEKLTSLLTAMTVHGYNNLFNVESTATPTAATSSVSDGNEAVVSTATRVGSEESSEENNVSGESRNTGKDDSSASNDDLLTTTSLPELRQLARNFSIALSSYLHDPDNFKKSLEGLRPTEPPPIDGSENIESSTNDDELLNFSDADVKPSTPAIPSATWGYIVASDSKKGINDDVRNSLNPDLNTADSQSFIPRFNNLEVDEKQQKGFTDLPPNHWTSSPQATKLWQKALSVNPAIVNQHFETTPSLIMSDEEETTEPELFNQEVLPDLREPQSQISYDLRELPPLSLNSTQVHGILIDFMNHTKSDQDNRLNRILKKLNTSEEEFLSRMKEIEENPLTKRLVLLLISECGANITEDLGLTHLIPPRDSPSQSEETLSALASTARVSTRNAVRVNRENHSLGQLVHPKLSEEDEDARALQLLNSLYTIASKFGRKR